MAQSLAEIEIKLTRESSHWTIRLSGPAWLIADISKECNQGKSFRMIDDWITHRGDDQSSYIILSNLYSGESGALENGTTTDD